jgi:hypothetical protein
LDILIDQFVGGLRQSADAEATKSHEEGEPTFHAATSKIPT